MTSDIPEPLNSAMRETATAWHHLCDAAQACVDMAADADPARFGVYITPDYRAALEQLRAATDSRVLHEVHDAAKRFQAAVVTGPSLAGRLRGGRMTENEVALMGAVLALRGALAYVDEAVAALEATDDPDDSNV